MNITITLCFCSAPRSFGFAQAPFHLHSASAPFIGPEARFQIMDAPALGPASQCHVLVSHPVGYHQLTVRFRR